MGQCSTPLEAEARVWVRQLGRARSGGSAVEVIRRVYCPIAWLPPGHDPGRWLHGTTARQRGLFLALGHFGSTTRPLGRGGESPLRRRALLARVVTSRSYDVTASYEQPDERDRSRRARLAAPDERVRGAKWFGSGRTTRCGRGGYGGHGGHSGPAAAWSSGHGGHGGR